jgi:hypothetical protein
MAVERIRIRRTARNAAITGALLILPGCADAQTPAPATTAAAAPAPAASAPLVCTVAEAGLRLPEAVRETSGLARGRADTTVFWTHNDSGGGTDIYGLNAGGGLARTIRVAGISSTDWEDIEAGPCDEGTCLYISDTGDNSGTRKTIDVYRVAEPATSAKGAVNATRISLVYPEGPEDAEALFVLPSKDIFVVTKGRHKTIALYAARAPKASGTNVLVKVRDLFPKPENERDRVTAATASPDGKWVAVRTYRTLWCCCRAARVRSHAVVGSAG